MEDVSDALERFLSGIPARSAIPDIVDVFHAVRQLPYLSDGDRSLKGVLQKRQGSCSGKHVLLAALLRKIGLVAEVELVLGDFATPFRAARGLPAALVSASLEGIRDVHNVVRVRYGGRSVILDATWHDAMRRFGLRVNDQWQGQGDTEIAVDVVSMLGSAADPASAKQSIISGWPQAEQQRRREFLEAVNAWVADVSAHHAEKS